MRFCPRGCEIQMNGNLGVFCILHDVICVTMSASRPVQNSGFRAFGTNTFIPSEEEE